uniref:Cytochrome P450 n=2 Tax=Corethron hystrix TaxID=216773 RepID=A0A7S1B828_9STRA
MYDSFSNGWKNAREIAMEKSYAFMDRASEDRLEGDFQRRSYLANALRRQAEGDAVTREELAEMGFLILSASLDTTSALVNWLVLHLALSPSTQRTLRKELTAAMRDRGAETLVPEMYQQVRTLPYLHAVLRESHRCTPAIPINVIKKNKASALEIHGETIPQNSSILLDSYSVGWDPEFVPQPERFRPERWMDDAVEGRKGTLRQVLDHKMYQKPFSQGARQCPASRVANFEVLTMISQLVLDWDIALSEESEKSVRSFQDVPYYQGTTVQPVMPGFSFTARS